MPGELEQFCRSFITSSCHLQQDGPEDRPVLWPLLVSAPLRAKGSPCHPEVLCRLQPSGTAPRGTHRIKHRQTVPYAGEVIHSSSTTVREAFPAVGVTAAFSAAWYKLREEWDAERWTFTSLGCTDVKYLCCLFSNHPNSLTGKNFKIKEHFLFLLFHRGKKKKQLFDPKDAYRKRAKTVGLFQCCCPAITTLVPSQELSQEGELDARNFSYTSGSL